MSDRDRLLLPMFITDLDGKKHRNVLRLDPRIAPMAAAAYQTMKGRRDRGARYKIFHENKPEDDIVEWEAWGVYTGFMGEASTSTMMGWKWNPVTDRSDPGYDFFEALRFEGRTLFWKIDSKTFDTVNPFRRKTVLLREMTRVPPHMIYLWCAYNADLDVAAPVGWMFGTEIHPETEARVPWGSDMELGRDRLHKIEELSTATWVPKAA